MRETTKKFTGGTYTLNVGGKITKTTGGNHNIWGESITYNAGGTITMSGKEKGVSFGEYVPIQDVYTTHPNVEKVEFVDEKGNILNQNTKDFYYGRKIKIRVITKNAKNGDLLYVTLKGITKSKNQKFDLMNGSDYRWNGKPIFDNKYETPLFEFNPNWYSDDFEYYDYDEHKTKIKEEDLNEFYVHAVVDASSVYLPVKGERLKPISYKRNYEELIGLFNTDNSGAKDLLTNYENKFIDSVKDFKTIVDDFSEYINEDNRDLTIDQIRTQVQSSAKKLWDEAVWQVQGHNLTTKNKDPKTGEEKTEVTKVQALLDDRPLYWARLAMQVILKRHPVFEKDIDLEKSLVKKGTELDKIIQLFEEKSRNYDGIDFSKAGSKKKVLITGFDPFLLNSIKYPNRFNILQSNPSGVVALALANDDKLEAFIQTMVVPVRYTDFDGSQDHDKGQGEGIIEKYIKPFINQVDMIITISQAGENEYNIDKFGTATRGGFNDNQDYKREADSHALITKDEWIETTLPKEFTNAPKVVYNWEFDNIPNPNHIKPIQTQKLTNGSGGDYLSNEIFYRVAKLRKDIKPILPTGHFHINKIQNPKTKEDLKPDEILDVLNTVKKGIEEGVKGL
jgi:pyrrolidone-carboxylate peptidase